MPRPMAIRHDDIHGRLDWLESQLDEMRPKSKRGAAEVDTEAMADAYPVQMRAPGTFPDEGDLAPAAESEAVIDSIRAKREGELRHENPIAPLEAVPADRLAVEATATAEEDFEAERKVIDAAPKPEPEVQDDKPEKPTPPKADKGK